MKKIMIIKEFVEEIASYFEEKIETIESLMDGMEEDDEDKDFYRGQREAYTQVIFFLGDNLDKLEENGV